MPFRFLKFLFAVFVMLGALPVTAESLAEKNEIIFIYKNKCPGDAEKSVEYLNKVMAYEREKSPYQHDVSCGIYGNGDVGCVDKTESWELRKKITNWQENNPEWGEIISLAWQACGIQDYEYSEDIMIVK